MRPPSCPGNKHAFRPAAHFHRDERHAYFGDRTLDQSCLASSSRIFPTLGRLSRGRSLRSFCNCRSAAARSLPAVLRLTRAVIGMVSEVFLPLVRPDPEREPPLGLKAAPPAGRV